MGFLKVFGLEKEKNEIGSYKYDKGLQVLENLDEYCLNLARRPNSIVPENVLEIEHGIKIGKYEIGGVTLLKFFDGLKFDTYNSIQVDDNQKHIFWIRNSETDEIKAYSNYNSNVRIFYDEKKDELFTYDEKGRDNLYVGLFNVKHYYARNYSTLTGFKYIDDTIPIPLTIYKLDIFACNFQELQALGTWSNQNEFNTLKKDQEKYDKIKEKILQQKEEEYLEREAEKKKERKEKEEQHWRIIYFLDFL